MSQSASEPIQTPPTDTLPDSIAPPPPHSKPNPLLLLKKKFSHRTLLIASAGLLLTIITIVGIYLILIGQKYQSGIQVDPGVIRQQESAEKKFSIRKITLIQDGETVEFNSSGEALRLDELRNRILNRHLFSFDDIAKMFDTLSQEEFEQLLTHYNGVGRSFTLIIETSHGIKTIVIDDSGTTPLPDQIEDIVDNIDDIIDDISAPPTSPPPTIVPTPLPTPQSPTFTPTPSFAPTPTPGSSPVPQDPFDCSMLQNQINDVTVSNTVCDKE